MLYNSTCLISGVSAAWSARLALRNISFARSSRWQFLTNHIFQIDARVCVHDQIDAYFGANWHSKLGVIFVDGTCADWNVVCADRLPHPRQASTASGTL